MNMNNNQLSTSVKNEETKFDSDLFDLLVNFQNSLLNCQQAVNQFIYGGMIFKEKKEEAMRNFAPVIEKHSKAT